MRQTALPQFKYYAIVIIFAELPIHKTDLTHNNSTYIVHYHFLRPPYWMRREASLFYYFQVMVLFSTSLVNQIKSNQIAFIA